MIFFPPIITSSENMVPFDKEKAEKDAEGKEFGVKNVIKMKVRLLAFLPYIGGLLGLKICIATLTVYRTTSLNELPKKVTTSWIYDISRALGKSLQNFSKFPVYLLKDKNIWVFPKTQIQVVDMSFADKVPVSVQGVNSSGRSSIHYNLDLEEISKINCHPSLFSVEGKLVWGVSRNNAKENASSVN